MHPHAQFVTEICRLGHTLNRLMPHPRPAGDKDRVYNSQIHRLPTTTAVHFSHRFALGLVQTPSRRAEGWVRKSNHCDCFVMNRSGYQQRVSDIPDPMSRWDIFKIIVLSVAISATFTGAVIYFATHLL